MSGAESVLQMLKVMTKEIYLIILRRVLGLGRKKSVIRGCVYVMAALPTLTVPVELVALSEKNYGESGRTDLKSL